MLASLALVSSFVRQMRRSVLDAYLTLPHTRSPRRLADRSYEDPAVAEQRVLDQWFYDRDSRWHG